MLHSFKKARIPKGNNTYRTIYIVDAATRRRLREHLPYLEIKLNELDTTGSVYAFRSNTNCVMNAKRHIGYQYTLSLDIRDFFDAVEERHIAENVDPIIINQCLIDGAPRQGLPTSPLIANIALIPCDNEIISSISQKVTNDFVYTRYADDIAISFNEKHNREHIQFLVSQVLERAGFSIHEKKTRFQCAKGGRRIITGIAVDSAGIYPTRKTKKKLRAALHQNNELSLNGLREWAKCKLPKSHC